MQKKLIHEKKKYRNINETENSNHGAAPHQRRDINLPRSSTESTGGARVTHLPLLPPIGPSTATPNIHSQPGIRGESQVSVYGRKDSAYEENTCVK